MFTGIVTDLGVVRELSIRSQSGRLRIAAERLSREVAIGDSVAVHGACLGGAMELISYCDFVVAAPESTLGQPEIKLAFLPPVACHKLPRLTGFQNAAYTILSGENLMVDQALAMGLVQKIVPTDDWAEIDDLFNGLSAPVLRITKQALAESIDERSAERLEFFKELFLAKLYDLEDVAEGIESFENRRPPEWKHK